MLVSATLGFVCGVLVVGGGFLHSMTTSRTGLVQTFKLSDGRPGLLFLTPASAVGRTIDAATGRSGFGHVAVHPCWMGSDGPLLIESDIRGGVRTVPAANYHGRQGALVQFAERDLPFVRGVAQGILAAPYRGRRGGIHCAEAALLCTPPRIREKIEPKITGKLSPNSLAEAFGVKAETRKEVRNLVEALRY
ncbi:MAG TPA: hypothetical protein ENJ85_05050 [Oceanithermus profundus]|uniref:Uncharacterized protein n=1 Tax=Oceanithermus profundus TaxID=187137 RepID=A0A7C5ST21_9DEIN|nr:hypothetical protein [Oceanithermus profundus]